MGVPLDPTTIDAKRTRMGIDTLLGVNPDGTHKVIGKATATSGSQNHPVINISTRAPDDRDHCVRDMPKGCITFMRRDEKINDIAVGSHVIVPLGALNYRLAVRTWMEKMVDQPSIQWVRDNFTLFGVNITDKGSTTYANGSRVVVINRLNLYTQVYNIWGEGVKRNTTLWLVCKLVPVGRGISFVPVAGEAVKYFHPNRSDGVPLPYPGYVVQMVPHATTERYVDMKDLTTDVVYPDGTRISVPGFAVKIGLVSDVGTGWAPGLVEGATDANALHRCPLITIINSQ